MRVQLFHVAVTTGHRMSLVFVRGCNLESSAVVYRGKVVTVAFVVAGE